MYNLADTATGKNIKISFMILLILDMLAVTPAFADCTCNKGSGTSILGLEYVATECPVEPPSENHYYHYVIYAVECPGAAIQNYAFYGDTNAPPGGFCNYLVSQGYRVLRNSSGTHLFAVSRYFNGIISGVNLSGLTPGTYYADLDQLCCNHPGNSYS